MPDVFDLAQVRTAVTVTVVALSLRVERRRIKAEL